MVSQQENENFLVWNDRETDLSLELSRNYAVLSTPWFNLMKYILDLWPPELKNNEFILIYLLTSGAGKTGQPLVKE